MNENSFVHRENYNVLFKSKEGEYSITVPIPSYKSYNLNSAQIFFTNNIILLWMYVTYSTYIRNIELMQVRRTLIVCEIKMYILRIFCTVLCICAERDTHFVRTYIRQIFMKMGLLYCIIYHHLLKQIVYLHHLGKDI